MAFKNSKCWHCRDVSVSFTTHTTRDVGPTEMLWEHSQKICHFKTASNSFWSNTWKTYGNAVPMRSRPTTPLHIPYIVEFRLAAPAPVVW